MSECDIAETVTTLVIRWPHLRCLWLHVDERVSHVMASATFVKWRYHIATCCGGKSTVSRGGWQECHRHQNKSETSSVLVDIG